MGRHCFRWIGSAVFLYVLVFLSAGFSSAGGPVVDGVPSVVAAPLKGSALVQKAQANGIIRILVRVETPSPAAEAAGEEPAAEEAAISAAQSGLLAGLSRAGAAPLEAYQFKYIPWVAMTVSSATLNALLASSDVADIEEDIPIPAVADSWNMTMINAPALHKAGVTGAGVTVAILDTGVDKLHPYLKGAVVSEACYSSKAAEYSATPVCPGGVTSSLAANSAMPYRGNCPAGKCDHGTHVAGITAGRAGVAGSPGAGVAPKANIIAIQIFSRFDSSSVCGTAPCVLTFNSDQIKGLERVYALRNTYTISSVNMSIGGGSSATNCDTDSRKAIIDKLRSAGIATVIAAGNNGYCGYISYPACISSAVSIGATDSSDGVSYYSNSASILSLFAPGSGINSSIPNKQYATWNGTSMATPHVAGAWALVKQGRPASSVTDILNAFSWTGDAVTDSGKCGTVTKQRIDVNEAYHRFLTVTIGGSKKGTVAADGLSCPSKTYTCSGLYEAGTNVTITATPSKDSFFAGWSNCPSPAGNKCVVNVKGGVDIVATFNPPPAIAAAPQALNFGVIASTGSYRGRQVTVRNTGSSDLVINSVDITATGTPEFIITGNTCGSALSKGKTCLITVTPKPASAASWGAKAATLVIASNASAKAATVKLAAVVGVPNLAVAPLRLDFGTVKIGKVPLPSRTFKITNTGVSGMAITTITPSGASFALDSTQCNGKTLAASKSCTATVTFNPTDTKAATGSVVVETNAPTKGTATVTLRGKGRN